MENAPTVSVLLPAWNESLTISRCIESLLAIESLNLEIIVCAGGSDQTVEIARGYERTHPAKVKVLPQTSGEGKQAALQRAYRDSHGEVIYLTDADCVISGDTLASMVEEVGPEGADAATGPAHPLVGQRQVPWVRHQWATTQAVERTRGRESTGLLGRNSAIRREAIDAVGAFREPVKIGTDYVLAKKLLAAGRTIHYLPKAVETQYHEGFLHYTAQQSRWMRNVLIHGTRFGQRSEVMNVTRSVALGVGLLIWPLTWKQTRAPGFALWLVPIGWMTRVRIAQQAQLEEEFDLEPCTSKLPKAVVHSLADLIVWARPALDLAVARRRLRW